MLNPPFHMLIVGMTACGKTHYLLQTIEKEFKGIFDYIFFVCPTFLENKTYQNWRYLEDEKVIAIPCEQDDVDDYLKTIVNFSKNTCSLIVLDDCASGNNVKNRTSEIVKLAFHGRHIGLSTIVNHTTINERRKTLQDERFKSYIFLHGKKRRSKRYI